MTNEEMVLDSIKYKVKNRKLSALRLSFPTYFSIQGNLTMETSLIDELKSQVSIEDRIYNIVKLSSRTFGTVHYKSGSYQCKPSARRSALDIMRIYKFYFEDIDLFTVMRTLYKLVEDRKLSTMKCPTIHKEVFWVQSSNWDGSSNWEDTELNIKFNSWRTIGENNE